MFLAPPTSGRFHQRANRGHAPPVRHPQSRNGCRNLLGSLSDARSSATACCSLDEPGKPSSAEDRSRLPPSQIVRASSGRRPATRLTTMQARTSQAAHHGSCGPHAARAAAGAAAARRTLGPDGCSPGRRTRLPHQEACTVVPGSGYQSLRLEFRKMRSSWKTWWAQ